MKRLIFIIPALIFTVLSCSKSKPKGILSESDMADVMTEVYAVDGYLNVLPIDSARKLLPVLYDNVFDRFHIDSLQFNQNIDFYYGNPVHLEKLLTEVQKRLSKYERTAIRQDSIVQAHVRDSVAVVQRWTRLAQEAEDRMLNVHIDTTTQYDLIRYNNDFFTGLGLDINRYIPVKPSAKVAAEENGPDEKSAEGVVLDEAPPTEVITEKLKEVVPVDSPLRPLRSGIPLRKQQ